MAQKVNIELVDDVDGSVAAETVTFGLDGSTYEIDLNQKNADKLRKALVEYTTKGRRLKGAPAKFRKVHVGPPAAEVREWARSNGHTVPDRGRIPVEVSEAYAQAH